jgi:hypothetical protein
MTKLHRLKIGRWHFCLGFGRFGIGIHRQAKRAGSVAFGFGLLTYMRQGKYEPLKRAA